MKALLDSFHLNGQTAFFTRTSCKTIKAEWGLGISESVKYSINNTLVSLVFLIRNLFLNSFAACCRTCRDGLLAVDRCSYSVLLSPTKKVKTVCFL